MYILIMKPLYILTALTVLIMSLSCSQYVTRFERDPTIRSPEANSYRRISKEKAEFYFTQLPLSYHRMGFVLKKADKVVFVAGPLHKVEKPQEIFYY